MGATIKKSSGNGFLATLTYFGTHELGLDFDKTLYEVPASRLMLMLNQHSLVNIGDEKVMTLSDMEAMEKLKGLKHG